MHAADALLLPIGQRVTRARLPPSPTKGRDRACPFGYFFSRFAPFSFLSFVSFSRFVFSGRSAAAAQDGSRPGQLGKAPRTPQGTCPARCPRSSSSRPPIEAYINVQHGLVGRQRAAAWMGGRCAGTYDVQIRLCGQACGPRPDPVLRRPATDDRLATRQNSRCGGAQTRRQERTTILRECAECVCLCILRISLFKTVRSPDNPAPDRHRERHRRSFEAGP